MSTGTHPSSAAPAARSGRRIVVTSNCQLGGLHAALSAMLPDDEVIAVPYHGFEPPELAELLPDADVWVSSYHPTEARPILDRLGSRAELVSVPLLLFTGFHPDIVHLMLPDGRELESAAGGYSSAIVAWGWMQGRSSDEILARFRPETFAALGYTASAWAGAVRLARYVFDEADADFDAWFLPLVARGGMFMLTDNHPRIDALVQLARQVATRLGAPRALVDYEWETVIPDGLLATSTVWPLYPYIADNLDAPGAYVWRCVNGELIDLETFVTRSLALYQQVDPASVTVSRFQNDRRVAAALGPIPGGVGA
jgi:hypothetical protein